MLADLLRQLAGVRLTDEDGNDHVLELQPPATDDEVRRLQDSLPCPIPADIRDALRVAKGLSASPLESFSLIDLEGFGLEELLPHAYSIAHDGFGNYWVLDLLPRATSWGPVFYVCHDPAVIAYQAPTIEVFLNDMVAMWQPGERSPVDGVHDDVVNRIWRDNPGLAIPADVQRSNDAVLRAFAETLPPTAVIADLRQPALGQGFSWGRFGPRTIIRRAGEERIWALIPPEQKPGFFARIFR